MKLTSRSFLFPLLLISNGSFLPSPLAEKPPPALFEGGDIGMEDVPPARICSLSHPKWEYRQDGQLSGLFWDAKLPVLQPGNAQAHWDTWSHCPVLTRVLNGVSEEIYNHRQEEGSCGPRFRTSLQLGLHFSLPWRTQGDAGSIWCAHGRAEGLKGLVEITEHAGGAGNGSSHTPREALSCHVW